MDINNIGKNIMNFRRKSGLTQASLAEKLKVSNKAVSKWESGQGYPEIGQLPFLAEIFGVSVDRLMQDEPKGIALAGNILVDVVKNIEEYPKKGMLASITSISRAVGGSVPNTGIDIAKIDSTIPLSAIGLVGNDEMGMYVTSQLQRYGLNTDGVAISKEAPTSFSDVISEPAGERTFFHARGANALFSPDMINIDALDCRVLHIGYIFLLDVFDQEDSEYGTVMARFLKEVQDAGIKTSIDVVSDNSADYYSKVYPALKYCNYAIMNEVESCEIWKLNPRNEDGSLNIENIKTAMTRMVEAGVLEKVVIHAKEAGFCLDAETGEFNMIPSLKIPKEEIKGSVGAGDAFCAGSLYGLYKGFSDVELLEFASAAAACNLFSENSIDGMRSAPEIREIMKKYPRREI